MNQEDYISFALGFIALFVGLLIMKDSFLNLIKVISLKKSIKDLKLEDADNQKIYLLVILILYGIGVFSYILLIELTK